MKIDDIQREIFEVPTADRIRFVRQESTFVNPFSREQVASIVRTNQSWGRIVENNLGIRLNGFKTDKSETVLELSTVSFYDFVSTNMLMLGNPVLDRDVAAKIHRWMGYNSYSQVLDDNSLSNLMTVSVLIVDDEDKIGIARRTRKVSVNPGVHGATVTATPSMGDYETDDPFVTCALREAKEELNLDDLRELSFRGLIIGRQKLQPVALYDARIPGSWRDYEAGFAKAEDYDFEIERIYPMSQDELFNSMATYDYTVVARYQIARYFNLL